MNTVAASTSSWNRCTYILWRAEAVNELCEPCHSFSSKTWVLDHFLSRKLLTRKNTGSLPPLHPLHPARSGTLTSHCEKQAGRQKIQQPIPNFTPLCWSRTIENVLLFIASHICSSDSSRSLNDFKNWAGQTWIILYPRKMILRKQKIYCLFSTTTGCQEKKNVFSQCWARSVVQAQPVDSVPCAAVAASGWHPASGWGPLDEGHHRRLKLRGSTP